MSPVLRADVAPSRRVLFVATAVVIASLALFVMIAEDLLDGGGLVAHDEAVLRWFVDHRTDWMISAARLVSAIGGLVSLLIASAVLALWLWRRGKPLAIAITPTVSLLLASVAWTAAKAAFGRVRPPISVQETRVVSPAFPSGHACDAAAFCLAAAFVIAITFADNGRRQLAFIGIGAFVAGLVGVSRLILGVHWLSDVVAGWALGTALATATVAISWYGTTRNPQPCRDQEKE